MCKFTYYVTELSLFKKVKDYTVNKIPCLLTRTLSATLESPCLSTTKKEVHIVIINGSFVYIQFSEVVILNSNFKIFLVSYLDMAYKTKCLVVTPKQGNDHTFNADHSFCHLTWLIPSFGLLRKADWCYLCNFILSCHWI
jgi:hypothetical protein